MGELIDKEAAERKERIFENVSRKIKEPSLYCVYEVRRLDYRPDEESEKPITQAKLESTYYSGHIPDSALVVIIAAAALMCSSSQNIGALVNFWARRDRYRASKRDRKKLVIPTFNTKGEIDEMLNYLVRYGLIIRTKFRPLNPVEGSRSSFEYLYLASSSALRLAKQIWIDFRNEIMGDPIRNCMAVDDAFARALRAQTMAPFFTSEKLKDILFSRVFNTEKGRFTVEAMMRFNPQGIDGPFEEDYDVIFEGITFRTNENTRTLDAKREVIMSHLDGLSNFVREHSEKSRPTFVVFCCEDMQGMSLLLKIVGEQHPQLVKRSLFTTGNVIAKSFALENPENLQDCFICFENTPEGKYKTTGALDYPFIKSKGDGFGTGI